jgi:hypothetical protein
MVGIDHDSVLRVVSGADRAGRARPRDKADGGCILVVVELLHKLDFKQDSQG